MIDKKFLDLVQENGWRIDAVTSSEVTAGCPRKGCGVRVKLRPVGPVPKACTGDDFDEITLNSPDDFRRGVRAKRMALGLSIEDMEWIAGLSTDHIAKMEKPRPSKMPGLMALFTWAEAAGFQIMLRPKELPEQTLRQLIETRDQFNRRRQVNRYWRRGDEQPAPMLPLALPAPSEPRPVVPPPAPNPAAVGDLFAGPQASNPEAS